MLGEDESLFQILLWIFLYVLFSLLVKKTADPCATMSTKIELLTLITLLSHRTTSLRRTLCRVLTCGWNVRAQRTIMPTKNRRNIFTLSSTPVASTLTAGSNGRIRDKSGSPISPLRLLRLLLQRHLEHRCLCGSLAVLCMHVDCPVDFVRAIFLET
jgi:hypothetical protein